MTFNTLSIGSQPPNTNPNKSRKETLVEKSTPLKLSITKYLITMRQKNRSVRTIGAYRWHLDRFTRWLRERGIVELDELQEELLIEWGASLYDYWEPATVKQAISAVRGWLKWCYQKQFIGENLATTLQTPQVKKRVQRTLWPEEIMQLFDGCNMKQVKGIRNAALVSLLVDSGLRAAEVCRLNIQDVNLERKELKVIIKGGNEERGYFGDRTVDLLKNWLEVRPAKSGVETMFTAMGGRRWNEAKQAYESSKGYSLTVPGLHRILSNLGKSVGVPAVSPHSFRRTFVCLLTEAGANDGLIQKWGRWEHEKMVKLYRQAYQDGKLYNRYTPTDFLYRNNSEQVM